jgi:diacylglycerol kinase family enzyme
MENPQAVLISNNPYEMGDLAGMGRRARIDGGVLGVLAVRVANAAQAARLVRGRQAGAVYQGVAREVVIEADTPTIPVGIDGEAVQMATPVRCTIHPGALRVRVPRERPGVPTPRRQVDGLALVHQAFGTSAARAASGDRPAARHRQPK